MLSKAELLLGKPALLVADVDVACEILGHGHINAITNEREAHVCHVEGWQRPLLQQRVFWSQHRRWTPAKLGDTDELATVAVVLKLTC